MNLVKSKQRVADHGEVFTPPELVESMINLVGSEADRIDSRFLEPACGSGNFLVPVLRRKLGAVDRLYRGSDFERRHHALLALMSIYGIELLDDNVAECRGNLLELFVTHMGLDLNEGLARAAEAVLAVNIVHGDALSMQTRTSPLGPIAFAEWAYLGNGRFHRRDFRFDAMTQASTFGEGDTLFADLGKHEIFTPTRDHGALTIADLAGEVS
ncbi:type III restriction endonuclease subunit M [Knoellia sinensis KCTC 19936]|uniref:Type III restriction endonuclease subunit M n=1 Tax=Knoellia sinensis KCTC 19936 TaxID=1385520 RepID=A0A0A0IYM5_9MICO|nr:N-6 DNA methylase [Knoellia sinensis]KGN30315.1 type III restriction endonuclease subunit M [Knoellia sinensis KCTC 19936]